MATTPRETSTCQQLPCCNSPHAALNNQNNQLDHGTHSLSLPPDGVRCNHRQQSKCQTTSKPILCQLKPVRRANVARQIRDTYPWRTSWAKALPWGPSTRSATQGTWGTVLSKYRFEVFASHKKYGGAFLDRKITRIGAWLPFPCAMKSADSWPGSVSNIFNFSLKLP